MMYTERDRTIALAAVVQCAALVQQLARQGTADAAALRSVIQSALIEDADVTEGFYGGVAGVTLGLQLIRDKLTRRGDKKDMEVARYVVALMQLEARLAKSPQVIDRIARGIDVAKSKAEYFQPEHPEDAAHAEVLSSLADLYRETLSNLSPRIIVNGDPEQLKKTAVVSQIRATLLAGVRAAVLWRQVGGRRWQVLFRRRRYVNNAIRVLDDTAGVPTLH